jgi:hypothetical protein
MFVYFFRSTRPDEASVITALPEMVIAMELEPADVAVLQPQPLIVTADELNQV